MYTPNEQDIAKAREEAEAKFPDIEIASWHGTSRLPFHNERTAFAEGYLSCLRSMKEGEADVIRKMDAEWEEVRAHVMHNAEGFDNERVNWCLSILDELLSCQLAVRPKRMLPPSPNPPTHG